MSRKLLAAVGAAAALTFLAQSANAVVVATIDGSYDTLGYDTPGLTFHNTSGYDLVGAQMVLHAYQGLNNGDVTTVPLGTLGAGDTNYVWGGPTVPHSLTAYDYDDEWGNTPSGFTSPDCVVGGGLCSLVGNFDVTFTATLSGAGALNGQAVFSVFSPTSNATGGFVGWEGLDPNGLSETVYDVHNGTLGGTLAVIELGLPPSTVPEPATLTLLGAGLAALGIGRRRKSR